VAIPGHAVNERCDILCGMANEGSAGPKQQGLRPYVLAALIALVAAGLVTGGLWVARIVEERHEDTTPLSSRYTDLVYGAGTVQMRDFEKAYYDRVFVVLQDERHDDKTSGHASAVVTTPDMRAVLADVFDALGERTGLSADEYKQAYPQEFVTALAAHPETVTSTVDVDLRKDGNRWKVVPNDEWDRAVTGDMATLYIEYYQKAVDDYVNQNP